MSFTLVNQHSINVLYSEHQLWLHSWLHKKLGCKHNAEDLTHDTFIRILHKQAPNGHAKKSASLNSNIPLQLIEPRAYLKTIARGILIDHWRRRDLEHAWLEIVAHQTAMESPSVESQQLLLGLLEQISRMLDGLKPKIRTAFLLAQLEGLTHDKIAASMAVSKRTIERYVAEALYHCYQLRYE